MIDLVGNQGACFAYGPKVTVCRARFAGAAATSLTLLDAMGIASVTQSSTTSGIFTVTLAEKFADFFPIVRAVAATTTDFHDTAVSAISLTAGTFTFTHYSAARGSTEVINNGLASVTTFHILVVGRGAM